MSERTREFWEIWCYSPESCSAWNHVKLATKTKCDDAVNRLRREFPKDKIVIKHVRETILSEEVMKGAGDDQA